MSSEASVSYAALILADASVDITSDSLLSVTKAAGVSVDNVWADTYAKALEGKDLKELLFSFAASAPAAAADASSGAAASGDAPVEEKKEEEAAEESDDDMGFGLFD